MHKLLAWIAPIVWFGDEIVRRAVYWTTFLSAVMSLVASYITPLYQYGWGAVVFAGVGTALVIIIVCSGGLVAWRYFHPLPKQQISHDRKILKDKFIYPGTSLGCFVPPSFHATFGADNENLRLFIDETHNTPGALGPILWTAKRRLLLKEIPKVSRGEMISIPILSQHEHGGQKLWRWGEGGSPEGGYLFIPRATYKGRVTITNASGQLEHCYFIIPGREIGSGNDMPPVIGEHMFNFPALWEAEDAGNVEETSFWK
jgi:hypothetical protein